MITNTPIVPGQGLGNTINLGSLMYSIINQLETHNYKIKLSYSDKQYLQTPISVTVPEIGLRLIFENFNKQELVLIEVTNFNNLRFSYNGINLNDIKEYGNSDIIPVASKDVSDAAARPLDLELGRSVKLPNLKQIYNQAFGPTFPGKLSKDFESYILSYPGISFNFTIKLTELIGKLKALNEKENDNAILSKLLNWDRSNDIECASLSIYHGSSWDNFHKTFRKSIFNKVPMTKPKHETSQTISINNLLVNLNQGLVKIVFDHVADKPPTKDYIIKIGKTTQQDILNILGPPDDYFNKFDSRLLIHNHLSKSFKIDLHDNSIYKFHNYFRFGIDFLYDLNSNKQSTGVIKKLIIHNGGITESLDFMKWNKCNWKIMTGNASDTQDPFDASKDLSVDSSMYFKDIPHEFFAKIVGKNNLRPVLLNRNETEFIDNDLDIISPEEISNLNAPLTKFPSRDSADSEKTCKTKTWGQSRLYGCNKCIWEVIESNGCISCVTIF